MCFDWLWGSGIEGVIKLFQADFIFNLDSFEVRNVGGQPQVFDTYTGFYFLHDFTFSSDAHADYSIARSEMAHQFLDFNSKYMHLTQKLLNLLTLKSPFCFVYYGPLSLSQANIFLALVNSKFGFIPGIINILDINDHSLDPGLDLLKHEYPFFVRFVDDSKVSGTENEWMGYDASWDVAFNDFSLL